MQKNKIINQLIYYEGKSFHEQAYFDLDKTIIVFYPSWKAGEEVIAQIWWHFN